MKTDLRHGVLHVSLLIGTIFAPNNLRAAGVVATPSETALVAAMSGGGTVSFSTSGIIYLTNVIVVSNNTVLDGSGQTIAISGSNKVGIFAVSPGATFVLSNLTLRDGLALGTDMYYNAFVSNSYGGAVSNMGTLNVYGCTFSNCGAIGAPAQGSTGGLEDINGAGGGAIYNLGSATILNSLFTGNYVTGGIDQPEPDIGPGGTAFGGALCNVNWALVINCVFSNNTATGGAGANANSYQQSEDELIAGGAGGAGLGGALFNSGTLIASNNTFACNLALGGNGGMGGTGESSVEVNVPGGPGSSGGSGGPACGGSVCCGGGTNWIINVTFWSNAATAGVGGAGGAGGSFSGRGTGGAGGDGGNGGIAVGGGIAALGGNVFVTNATVSSNSLASGSGGAGGSGYAPGYPVTAGANGTNGLSGYIAGSAVGVSNSVTVVKNTILAASFMTDTNLYGPFTDAGNNISFDNQNSLTNPTSLNGVNPLLGPLAYNGGPTPTMALLAGSPAIDAADPASFPATDQRGYPRPYGPAPDIGAFEYYPPPGFFLDGFSGGILHLGYVGTKGQSFRIQGSVDLMNWVNVSTNTLGSAGYLDQSIPATNCSEYFRAVSP